MFPTLVLDRQSRETAILARKETPGTIDPRHCKAAIMNREDTGLVLYITQLPPTHTWEGEMTIG